MKDDQDYKTLEESIIILKQETQKMPVSIEKVMHLLSGKGRVLFLIFLSLPFCQPIQLPGMSTPFGLMIAFLGLRMSFGKHAWLPKWILSKKISSHSLEKIADNILFLIKKMKPWIHPRLSWLCHSHLMEIINGLTIFMLGLFLSLPLPIPFSNLLAAWAIFLMALGISEDDGLLVLIGYLITCFTIAVFTAIVLTVNHIF